jgi:ribosome-associated protein
MMVASGRSDRHVGALAERVMAALKEQGLPAPRVEGMPVCDWVLIDTGDIIVHLFRPEVRGFYNLEKLWGAGRPTDRVAEEAPKRVRSRSK